MRQFSVQNFWIDEHARKVSTPQQEQFLHSTWLSAAFRDHASRTGYPSVIIATMLLSLRTLHAYWNSQQLLSATAVDTCQQSAHKVSECWATLQWKPTPWVHWLCAHSSHLLSLYHTLYHFSSIPTEQRHKWFKQDLAHSFRGYSTAVPAAPGFAMRHLQRMYSLDVGLLLTVASQWNGSAHQFWRKPQPSI